MTDELPVAEFEAIQLRTHLVREGMIKVFKETEAFAGPHSGVLDQVESLELAEGRDELPDLEVIEMGGDRAKIDFVLSVFNTGREVSRDETRACGRVDDTRKRFKILRPADLELVGAYGDAIEEEDVGSVFGGAGFEESERLSFIHLNPDDGRGAGTTFSGRDHGLVEELHQDELVTAHGHVPDVQALGLAEHHGGNEDAVEEFLLVGRGRRGGQCPDGAPDHPPGA